MTDCLPHNDQPITAPTEDRFGVDPFARALAASFRKMQLPQGSVIGLNGPWGAGKSSAVNLIKHHLTEAVESNEIVVIDFACWWFRGEDALALAFFRELYAGLGPTLDEKIKKKLPKLGARLLRAGALVGKVAEAAGAGVAGGIAEKGMEWVAGLIEQEESVEKIHSDISKALREQDKRFLIVIDDIDRLSPDEAILIFRLVKSVGRLPNVMYLLVYDRQLAEKVVSEHYPSEGPHYLEKIVQAAFELPEPAPIDIQRHLEAQIKSICGSPPEGEMVRFLNIFHDGIWPSMRTPRDVTRLTNCLSVSWPAVQGEVDQADFVALEMLRLVHPAMHRAIRQNKDFLCSGAQLGGGVDRRAETERINKLFFGGDPKPDDAAFQRLLMRLFPRLEATWNNKFYADGFGRKWSIGRHVCSAEYFDSYFRFSIGDGVLSRVEIEIFLDRIGDIEFVKGQLRRSVGDLRSSGGTKAAVWLTELGRRTIDIDPSKIQLLLDALYEIADEIDVEADDGRPMSMVSNQTRLHWLARALTIERMSLDQRSSIFRHACGQAALGWLGNFTISAWLEHHPEDGKSRTPEEKCLTTQEDADYLHTQLKTRIEAASLDGSLIAHRRLGMLMHWWKHLAGDDGTTVREWTSRAMATDEGTLQLARACTRYGTSWGMDDKGMGDLVATRTVEVKPSSMADLINLDAFRQRVQAVASVGKYPEIQQFLQAWRRADDAGED